MEIRHGLDGLVLLALLGAVLFRNFTLTARWGRLAADAGVLRAADGATLSVPVTRSLQGSTLHGDGGTATLAPAGWCGPQRDLARS